MLAKLSAAEGFNFTRVIKVTFKVKELESLVQDIKNGSRAALFPPGTFVFVASIMLIILSIVACIGPVISIFASDLSIPARAGLQMLGLPILFLGSTGVPAILVMRGNIQYSSWPRVFVMILMAVAATLLSLALLEKLETERSFLVPLLLSLAANVVVLMLIASPRYKRFCMFYYLLKK